ncbi:hypothetical protein KZ810_11000 [Sphingomonas sp. RHCKR47]|uniref:hypothetical protein n=1 Tax=Sphingomonas citricola TaxID=2862498 RepID=UPI001CA4722B|nr:hypothetical protein [Sphingomonas citricola]MBW6524023.1 hypothetical protein [Sphingomonas citricola]
MTAARASRAIAVVPVRGEVAALATRLASAGAATALLSGFNFLLGIVLVRRLPPVAFGAWAVMTTLQAIAAAIVTAGFAQQMAYAFPRSTSPASLRAAAGVFDRMMSLALLLLLPVTIATLVALRLPVAVVLAGCAYTAAATYRGYVRARGFALRRPTEALRGDAVYVVVATAGLLVLRHDDRLAPLLLLLALANVAALGRSHGMRATSFAQWRRAALAYRRHLPRVRWSVVTIALSTAVMLSPNLALASPGSLVALATVAAPAALLAPLRLVALTAQAFLRAEFAALIHAGRVRAALTLYAAAGAAALLIGTLLAGAVSLGWGQVHAYLFAKYDDGALLWQVTTLSLLVATVNIVRLPGAMLLNALGIFRAPAIALAVLVMPVLGWTFCAAQRGYVAQILWAPLLSEALLLAVEGIVLARAVRAGKEQRACAGC